MTKLYMLMGLPGSGKTTVGRKLEIDKSAVLLTPDVWMERIVGNGFDADRRKAVHAVQLDLAERLLKIGCDVILEFGFFSREERDIARSCASRAGAESELVFLDPPLEELRQRLEVRNADLPPHTFPVSIELLGQCNSWMDRPHSDEKFVSPEELF